tara:strand:+ start:56 stop:568 length:513 start_codon:yes stop_codon:yes gene_type:complete
MHLIVALNQDNIIGNNNDIPWTLKNDLQRFKKLTNQQIIVMGRKTYESLPVRPLKNRINVVVTNNPDKYENQENLFFVNLNDSLSLLKTIQEKTEKKIFIIGGTTIYEYFFQYCTHFYITEVWLECEGNVFFPFNLQLFKDKTKYQLTYQSEQLKEDNVCYSFSNYEINN